jgi:hypothetical protein
VGAGDGGVLVGLDRCDVFDVCLYDVVVCMCMFCIVYYFEMLFHFPLAV